MSPLPKKLAGRESLHEKWLVNERTDAVDTLRPPLLWCHLKPRDTNRRQLIMRCQDCMVGLSLSCLEAGSKGQRERDLKQIEMTLDEGCTGMPKQLYQMSDVWIYGKERFLGVVLSVQVRSGCLWVQCWPQTLLTRRVRSVIIGPKESLPVWLSPSSYSSTKTTVQYSGYRKGKVP